MTSGIRTWAGTARRVGRAGTVGLLLCGVTAVGWVVVLDAGSSGPTAPGAASGAADLAPAPVWVHALELPVPNAPVRRMRTAPRATERFSMVGITWDDPRSAPAGVVQVRTRSLDTRRWSTWRELEIDDGAGPAEVAAAGSRGGTAPLWVGRADGVQVSVDGKRPHRLPQGMRLDLIDPEPGAGTPQGSGSGLVPVAHTGPVLRADGVSSPADESDSPSPSPSASPTNPVTQPAMVTRKQWRADERIRRRAKPGYASAAKVVFVHHTAGSNSYSCASSPAIVRSIYGYHVRGRGWDDIGYNFLVDRCGTLFEGRYGGVTRAVIGAHTGGFNAGSAGVSVLGTYGSKGVSWSARVTVAHVVAWKLGFAGLSPSGTATLRSSVSGNGKGFVRGRYYRFRTVSGHRDAKATECPGLAFYRQLSGIRTMAGKVKALSIRTVNGVPRTAADIHQVPGQVQITWSVGTPARLIRGYQLLVDGVEVGEAKATATTATVEVPPGEHVLGLRSVHVSGTSTTARVTVLVEGDGMDSGRSEYPAVRQGREAAGGSGDHRWNPGH